MWKILVGAVCGRRLLAILYYWGAQSYNYPIRVHGRYEREGRVHLRRVAG